MSVVINLLDVRVLRLTSRFLSLQAKVHIPIIASVSEHQPTAWPSFFFDLQILIWLFPAGVFLCFRQLRDEHVFVIVYALVASYFAGVMVRLMLTLTPVVCLSAALAISRLFETYLDPILPGAPTMKGGKSIAAELLADEDGSTAEVVKATGIPDAPLATPTKASKKKGTTAAQPAETYTAPLASASTTKTPRTGAIHGLDLRLIVVTFFTALLAMFVLHCTFVTSSAYSSPSVVLASRSPDGSQNIIDDFREAYFWLRRNTDEDAKIASWWDYG